MGSQVIAIWECGVNTKISIGGGRLSYKVIDYFAGFCKNCKEVMRMNLKDDFPVCMSCIQSVTIPYNDLQLIGSIGKNIVAKSFNVLTDGKYYCPNCNKNTLRFLRGSLLWD